MALIGDVEVDLQEESIKIRQVGIIEWYGIVYYGLGLLIGTEFCVAP